MFVINILYYFLKILDSWTNFIGKKELRVQNHFDKLTFANAFGDRGIQKEAVLTLNVLKHINNGVSNWTLRFYSSLV